MGSHFAPEPSRGITSKEKTMLKVGIPPMTGGLRVADVMTTEVTFLETNQTLDEAWQILHAKSISGAPVLNARGRLVGIASKADLADPRHRAGDVVGVVRTVKDVMTQVVYAVRARDSVLSAVKLMIDEDIHRAVVVSDNGSVAGIVTPMDVLRVLVRGEDIAGSVTEAGSMEFVDLRALVRD
jgi:CBS-domain-containing membrane protein